MGSILRGIEVPPDGGDTLFANMYAVYEALPDDMKGRIRGLRVWHSHDQVLSHDPQLKNAGADYARLPAVNHPLVRRHPITGRLSLFLSPHTMVRIDGLPEEDGRALLDELTAFATQERFVYRHKWRRDDVILWDNRCTMHAVMPYDAAHVRRIMHRTTIGRGVAGAEAAVDRRRQLAVARSSLVSAWMPPSAGSGARPWGRPCVDLALDRRHLDPVRICPACPETPAPRPVPGHPPAHRARRSRSATA
jgi:hypothetical protein